MDKAELGALREELAPILTKMFQLMDSDGSGAIGGRSPTTRIKKRYTVSLM
jgi:hypothetical protein